MICQVNYVFADSLLQLFEDVEDFFAGDPDVGFHGKEGV